MNDIFVNGRLCLFGEHSDWVGGDCKKINKDLKEGQCIVFGINEGIYAKYEKNNDIIIESIDNLNNIYNLHIKSEFDIIKHHINNNKYFKYICGTIYYIKNKYNIDGGIYINNYKTTIQQSAGLSSSAAICVLVAKIFNNIYNLQLNNYDIMNIAYNGELMAGSKCGKMDQCIAFGKGPFKIIFNEDSIAINDIKLKHNIYILIIKLNGCKNTINILNDLHKAFPYPITEDDINLENLFGEYNINVTNNAEKYLTDNNIKELGNLMNDYQTNFKLYASKYSNDLKSPLLYKILNDIDIQKYILGGKGVGSHGDGCCQLLCSNEGYINKIIDILSNKYSDMDYFKLIL